MEAAIRSAGMAGCNRCKVLSQFAPSGSSLGSQGEVHMRGRVLPVIVREIAILKI